MKIVLGMQEEGFIIELLVLGYRYFPKQHIEAWNFLAFDKKEKK